MSGVAIGSSTYNNYRSDIATLFPGLANSNGAVGFRILDTTTLADGLHTLAWTATDSGGFTEGLGSRFFGVANGFKALTAGGSDPEGAALSALPVRQGPDVDQTTLGTVPLSTSSLVVRRGWDPAARWLRSAATEDCVVEEVSTGRRRPAAGVDVHSMHGPVRTRSRRRSVQA